MRWIKGLTIEKDPNAVLDYKFDWSDWLAVGETITSASVTATTGLTVDSSSITDTSTSVTVWLSGGTPQVDYTLRCRVTTSNSPARVDDRSVLIRVIER